jgi:hypothetical protein
MTAPVPRPTVARDTRIDFARGMALMMIFVDHIPANTFARFTLHSFGFADAAEVFVLIAGYSSALAFGADFRRGLYLKGTVRILARCWQLYVTHIALFLAVCGLIASFALYFDHPAYLEADNFAPVFHDPSKALPLALTLTYLPAYLDILPLYIVLLLLFPGAYRLVQLHPALALAASLILYASSKAYGWTLPNFPDHGWFFNPFAWQLLFVVGVVAGHGAACGRSPARPRWLTSFALAYVAGAFVVAAPWTQIPGLENLCLVSRDVLGPMDKTNLSVWRLLHVLAVAYLVASFVDPQHPFLSGPVARPLILCGRHSLEVFSFGIVLSFLGRFTLTEVGNEIGAEAGVTALGVLILVLTGSVLSWYASQSGSRSRSAVQSAFAPSLGAASHTGLPAIPSPSV